MDEVSKAQFKWKFYKLTILLNLLVILIALAIILAIIGPVAYRIPVPVILLIGAAFLSWYLIRQYNLTKKWLYEHA